MSAASEFRDLASGRKRGLGATIARGLMRLMEFPYAWAMHYRNRRFDAGRDVQQVDVPVVSVGNLTLGGTGKTPLVEWIARWYRGQGVRVALVSRGYGAAGGARNDEARELEQKLPDVPHVQNRDRVAGARLAIEEFESQLILLDDGFQHRRLARDLDIVVVDALEPFGFEHVFPRGTLREPLAGLARAAVVMLSRSDQVDAATREAIRRRVGRLAPRADWLEACHRPRQLLCSGGRGQSLDWLKGRRVAAFCGIGNPLGFRRTLEECGCQVIELREFPDHHRYSREDIEALASWANAQAMDAVLTTHKDLVKLEVDYLGRTPLWALVIGIEFRSGQELLEARLARLIQQPHEVAGADAVN